MYLIASSVFCAVCLVLVAWITYRHHMGNSCHVPTRFLPTVDLALVVPLSSMLEISRNAPQVVDDVLVLAPMRILVAGNEMSAKNGIYTVHSNSTWTRTTHHVEHAAVYVRHGTLHRGSTWLVISLSPTECIVKPSNRVWLSGPMDHVWSNHGWIPWHDRQRRMMKLEGHDVYDLAWPLLDGTHSVQITDGENYIVVKVFVCKGKGRGIHATRVGHATPKIHGRTDTLRIKVPFPEKTYHAWWMVH